MTKIGREGLQPVPSVEPDYRCCRAAVLSAGFRQCARRPVAIRQAADGKLYGVCRQHRQAEWFFPWIAAYQMPEDARMAAIRRGDGVVGWDGR